MAKGKETGDDKRAQVIAALLTGQGVNEVARCYKVSPATVSRIRRGLDAGELKQVETVKKEKVGDLIVDYLNAALGTLRIQAEHARDKAWLEKQSAENLAILHGVIADKSIRILEAIEPATETELGNSEGDREPARIH